MRPIPIVAILCLSASVAWGQSAASSNQWSRGSDLAVVAGAASSSSSTGPMIAGSVGWALTRWVAIEGRGSWFDRGTDASAFSADLNATANVVSKRQVTPFVGAGFGLYRASFETAATSMPSFYRMRTTARRGTDRQVFTDPALRLTTGVDVTTSRHWSLRPEVSMVVVRSGGRGETLMLGSMRLAYRFEDHPITPVR